MQISSQDSRSIQRMFGRIAGRYDLANRLLSLGQDQSWRKYVARRAGEWNPKRILDLAAGSGVLAEELQKAIPDAELLVTDFCEPMLRQAQRRGLSHLVVADGLNLPFAGSVFDVVTIAFGLRNMASYQRALAEMARVLRPGGYVVILDFSLPGFPWRTIYRTYLHFVLPQLAGWITGESKAYEYLGESIEAFPSGNAMISLLESSGFRQGEVKRLTGGVVSCYIARRHVEEGC